MKTYRWIACGIIACASLSVSALAADSATEMRPGMQMGRMMGQGGGMMGKGMQPMVD